MVAKLATIKSRKIFMYIVALYGNEWYMYLTDTSLISWSEGKFWPPEQSFWELADEAPRNSKAVKPVTNKNSIAQIRGTQCVCFGV